MTDSLEGAGTVGPNPQERLGGCLCGAVRYRVTGEVRQPTACHCHMCRRHQGALGVFIGSQREAVMISGAENILWFASSPGAERGSCRRCGGKLFWRDKDGTDLDITLGSLDRRDDLAVQKHIWVAHRGDYETISDQLEKYAESSVRGGEPAEPLTSLAPLPASPSADGPVHNGRCLCGKIQFQVAGPLQDVVICHCSQCQHWHGAAGAYTAAPRGALALQNADDVVWYEGAADLRRAFCPVCTSCLFWETRQPGVMREQIFISAGALDAPTGLKTAREIFLSEGDAPYRMSEGLIRAASGWSSAAGSF